MWNGYVVYSETTVCLYPHLAMLCWIKHTKWCLLYPLRCFDMVSRAKSSGSKHGTFTYLNFCLCEHVPNCVVLNPTHSVHIYFLFLMHSVISFLMTLSNNLFLIIWHHCFLFLHLSVLFKTGNVLKGLQSKAPNSRSRVQINGTLAFHFKEERLHCFIRLSEHWRHPYIFT